MSALGNRQYCRAFYDCPVRYHVSSGLGLITIWVWHFETAEDMHTFLVNNQWTEAQIEHFHVHKEIKYSTGEWARLEDSRR